jgi:mitochondrial fission protein ELM1
MSATPGCPGIAGTSIALNAREPNPSGAVWVLEDARSRAANPGLAIAERLGMEFRRIPLWWNLRAPLGLLARRGSLAGLLAPLPLASGPPALTLSSGRASAAVAAWLKYACGSRMVHYGPAGAPRHSADLLLADAEADRADRARALPLLGPPHRLTATSLHAAHTAWSQRLDHLPRPRLALIVGSGPFGAELQPSALFQLAAGLAAALHRAGGAILATAGCRTGREATDALASGLAGCPHLIHRQGEPGPDPELGFLALADAIVVAGQAPQRLLRACALTVPVYVTPAGPLSPSYRRLHRRLRAAGQIRPLDGAIEAWTRAPLDEAGRAARRVLELLSADRA